VGLLSAGAPASGPVSPRIVGVDVARAVALLGMMSVHILPELDSSGRVTAAFVVFAGRSSALFALLAGTGLALATGGRTPRLRPWRGVSAALLTRAAIVALIGLVLGQLSPPVAVILTNYGLLFVVALAVLAVPVRWLFALAGGWVLASPLLSHLARTSLPRGPGDQPSLTLLAHPVELVRALVLTGYYPIAQWTAYLLVGLAVGRLALGRTRTSATLVAVGLTLAVGSRLVSDQLLAHGGLAALRAAGPASLVPADQTVSQLQLHGQYGVPPTTTWWWQAVASPHTATAFDLTHTIGSALAVLGVVLLLTAAAARGPRTLQKALNAPLAVLAATGSMTLTLYTAHVVGLAGRRLGPTDPGLLLVVNVVAALVLATLWRAKHARGPVEQLVATAAAVARRQVTPALAASEHQEGRTSPRSRRAAHRPGRTR